MRIQWRTEPETGTSMLRRRPAHQCYCKEVDPGVFEVICQLP